MHYCPRRWVSVIANLFRGCQFAWDTFYGYGVSQSTPSDLAAFIDTRFLFGARANDVTKSDYQIMMAETEEMLRFYLRGCCTVVKCRYARFRKKSSDLAQSIYLELRNV